MNNKKPSLIFIKNGTVLTAIGFMDYYDINKIKAMK
jgi:hypothetical protein